MMLLAKLISTGNYYLGIYSLSPPVVIISLLFPLPFVIISLHLISLHMYWIYIQILDQKNIHQLISYNLPSIYSILEGDNFIFSWGHIMEFVSFRILLWHRWFDQCDGTVWCGLLLYIGGHTIRPTERRHRGHLSHGLLLPPGYSRPPGLSPGLFHQRYRKCGLLRM
jgi:hypothetical protein